MIVDQIWCEPVVACPHGHHTRAQEATAGHDADAAKLKLKIKPDAFFSAAPDCESPLVPDSVSQRYERMVGRLGIRTTLHKLRHYNATEFLAAGVDLRTVAGRLGHGGGGTTTLRVYAAWVDEAGANAASIVASRMPTRPDVRSDEDRTH